MNDLEKNKELSELIEPLTGVCSDSNYALPLVTAKKAWTKAVFTGGMTPRAWHSNAMPYLLTLLPGVTLSGPEEIAAGAVWAPWQCSVPDGDLMRCGSGATPGEAVRECAILYFTARAKVKAPTLDHVIEILEETGRQLERFVHPYTGRQDIDGAKLALVDAWGIVKSFKRSKESK